MLPLQNDARAIKKFAKQFAEAYKDCFAWYSEEKYVRGFATRHFETVCAINEDENGIKISKKNKKTAKQLFIPNKEQIEIRGAILLNTFYINLSTKKLQSKKQEYVVEKINKSIILFQVLTYPTPIT